jgi:CubicO group peptidase (beta-lactamase class C family)
MADLSIQRILDGLVPPFTIKDETSIASKLSERMETLHIPGASVAVIHDGKIQWARGFGVAAMAGPKVTPETLFQAASLSKPVTAMALLRLAQEGKLELDADVNKYLKTWKVPENNFVVNVKVTLRELLNHTGGTTVQGFPGYASCEPVPSLIQVLNGEKPANTEAITVDMEPGKIWRYSGGGYVVLQQLLEDVTGVPFPQFLQDKVFSSIGMKHSAFEQPLSPNRMAEAAMPHDSIGRPIPGGPHTYPELAAAGLWTTPSDLCLFALEVQKSLAGTTNQVLSAIMTKEMLKPGSWKWGLGFQVGLGNGHPYFVHNGINAGYQNMLATYNSGDGAVLMTNGDNGLQLAKEIFGTFNLE